MSELYIPKPRSVIKLEMQPDFPNEDLNQSNTSMLKHIIGKEAGVATEAERLQVDQRYVHLIADQALKVMGIKTRYAEEELYAFSHGFASFETINDMVHPPRLYNMQAAQTQVQRLFVDCRESFEREMEELLTFNGEMPIAAQSTRDLANPELALADRHTAWVHDYPNTHDVIVELGEQRDETMPQIHARTAGAHLAYTLQHQELDAA